MKDCLMASIGHDLYCTPCCSGVKVEAQWAPPGPVSPGEGSLLKLLGKADMICHASSAAV